MEAFNQFHGWLIHGEQMGLMIGASILFLLAIGYLGAPFFIWALFITAVLHGLGLPLVVTAAFVVVALVFIVKPIRKATASKIVMSTMKALKLIPRISETERTALEAGVVWAEAELFSGSPNFKKLINEPAPKLTEEEQAFMDGPVNELCEAVDEWEIYKSRRVPEEVFKLIRKHKFLGLMIPKEYGGLEFSHYAHSEIIHKISSRSSAVAIYVMVPNSLGPAELLNHYGTDAQKSKYLPRLAAGEEIPCFGLTEPQAGSDAGSISSDGVLFKGDDGKIYVKLNWQKRWITLAAISTLIGLAFRLRDPDNLLGKGEDLGITCALIPSNTPGVDVGRRHDPLSIPFHNCPMYGRDVVVNAEEAIIGGLEGAGKGWGMLMESLGAGRGVSLPAQGAIAAKVAARVAGNHSAIRKQFGLPIGKFEGVEEPLSRIGGAAYYCEALRKYVLSALNQDIKPPVVTAIAKYNATEFMRKSFNDAMDVLGGQGISMGPKNLLAIGYMALPISITVEGANILTRTLMIFGQGALRAHPYAFKEVNAIENNDLTAFDEAFWGHIGHITKNKFRSFILSLTRGRLAGAPVGGPTKRYYQKLAWTSASFAILSDMAMGLLGGKLKIKEKLTGRFADILSWMFIGTAVLKRWEDEGRKKEDLIYVHYSMQVALNEIQKAFDGIFANFDHPLLGWFFKGPIRVWSSINPIAAPPSDALGHQVAQAIQEDTESRDRLTEGIYMPTDLSEPLAFQEHTFKAVKRAEAAEAKIKKAIKAKKLPKKKVRDVVDEALEKGVLTQSEFDVVKEAAELRWQAIQVDDFSDEEYESRDGRANGDSGKKGEGAGAYYSASSIEKTS